MSMMREATPKSYRMLVMNTLAFTVAFAAWMLNGVLITFLVSNGVYSTGLQLRWELSTWNSSLNRSSI